MAKPPTNRPSDRVSALATSWSSWALRKLCITTAVTTVMSMVVTSTTATSVATSRPVSEVGSSERTVTPQA